MRGTIYHPVTLIQALEYVISSRKTDLSHFPTTAVVCCAREDFENQVVKAVGSRSDAVRSTSLGWPSTLQSLSTLFISGGIKLVFCDSTATLHAYLSALQKPHQTIVSQAQSGAVQPSMSSDRACFFILNPVLLHLESTSNSAQGLGETFAAALEAAWRTDQALVIMEPIAAITGEVESTSSPLEPQGEDGQAKDDENMKDIRSQRAKDPWDTDVPIVNSSTKSFGPSLDRARMKRTTSIRAIAAQWCVFKSLPESS